jgi:hypothetical protein
LACELNAVGDEIRQALVCSITMPRASTRTVHTVH